MKMDDRYPEEVLSEDQDDGTMPANVQLLADAVVGRRIVSVEKRVEERPGYVPGGTSHVITLDDGHQVRLADTYDCCASTELEAFLLHPDKVDHVILGVGTTEQFTRWHVFADWGDVLELTVSWDCGNPFYYGYGFDIDVVEA